MQENAIRTTYQLLIKARSTWKYAFFETLLTLPLWILMTSGFFLFLNNDFSAENAFVFLFSHSIILFGATLLLLLEVAFIPLHFYLQFRFKIAVMYSAYDILCNRPASIVSAWERSRGKWHLFFTALYRAKFAALRLSLQQSQAFRKTGENSENKFMLHNAFFVIPIVLFEHKTPEEAILVSAKLFTREYWLLLRSQLGFEIGLPLLVVLASTVLLISTLLVSFRYPFFIIALPLALLLWFTSGTFWGLLQSYSRSLFLVVLYVFAKDEEVSTFPK